MYDFHIHSTWSNGVLDEVQILQEIKEKKIKFFSLTDCNTIEGAKRILEHNDFLIKNDIKFLIGVELITSYQGRETHLLAYGFEENSEFMQELFDLLKVSTITPSAITEKVHKAGGKVFLAHPFGEDRDEIFEDNEFNDYVTGLIKDGIDGMECYYPMYNNAQINYLLNIAKEKNILISGGSGYYGTKDKIGKIGEITLEDCKVSQNNLTILSLFNSKEM